MITKDVLKDFRYSVAIRTLGQAGEKYQQELDSLNNQTIKPEKIVVYLAERYDKPKETIGWEEIVYVKKGMVAQRALQYTEIETPYILLLDDDVFIPRDGVEKLAKGLLENEGDCIAADTFPNHKMSLKSKVMSFVTGWAYPHFGGDYAIKIHHTGHFSYLNNPKKDVYLADNVAGPCSLWKKKSLLRIHYEDELWLDDLGFAYGDEMLFFYKLRVNGGKLFLHYSTGIEHLDAKSTRISYNADKERLRKRARAWFLLWWRTDFSREDYNILNRTFSLSIYIIRLLWTLLVHIGYSFMTLSIKPILYLFLGNIDGLRYVHSSDYMNIQNFKITF